MKAKHLASYDIRKIKVLQRDFRPQRALDLMPPEPLAYLKNFQQCIEKSERQIEAELQHKVTPTPYWDPKLKHSLKARLELYRALFSKGLLSFRHRTKSKIGLFFVKKKDGMIRLVVDARCPSECHHTPPKARLATPACCADIDLSAASLEANGFGEVAGVDVTMSGAEGDVGDCFHNFCVEELASWFSVDEWKTIAEWEDLGFPVGKKLMTRAAITSI